MFVSTHPGGRCRERQSRSPGPGGPRGGGRRRRRARRARWRGEGRGGRPRPRPGRRRCRFPRRAPAHTHAHASTHARTQTHEHARSHARTHTRTHTNKFTRRRLCTQRVRARARRTPAHGRAFAARCVGSPGTVARWRHEKPVRRPWHARTHARTHARHHARNHARKHTLKRQAGATDICASPSRPWSRAVRSRTRKDKDTKQTTEAKPPRETEQGATTTILSFAACDCIGACPRVASRRGQRHAPGSDYRL